MYASTKMLQINLIHTSTVGEREITQFLKVKDLCVTFDQFRNFNNHITSICRLRSIGKICNLLSYDVRSTINNALNSCRLDYYNSLFNM